MELINLWLYKELTKLSLNTPCSDHRPPPHHHRFKTGWATNETLKRGDDHRHIFQAIKGDLKHLPHTHSEYRVVPILLLAQIQ